MSSLPSRIKLGDRTIKVRSVRRLPDIDRGGHEAGGDYGDGVIRVHAGQTPGGQRSALIHELLHACAEAGLVSVKKADEERVVGAIDGWLFLALKENPDLRRWLFDEG